MSRHIKISREALWSEIRERVQRGWWLLSCDLGYPHLNRLMEHYPKRVLNVGIAEQSAIGIASGLAKCGERVMVYGIGCQVAMRACEQIHFAEVNGLSFVIIGIGHGGYYGKASGISHDSDIILNREFAKVTGFTIAKKLEDMDFKFSRPLYLPVP